RLSARPFRIGHPGRGADDDHRRHLRRPHRQRPALQAAHPPRDRALHPRGRGAAGEDRRRAGPHLHRGRRAALHTRALGACRSDRPSRGRRVVATGSGFGRLLARLLVAGEAAIWHPAAVGQPSQREASARAPSRMGARAALVSAATMLSRVLGLVREQLFAALLGASAFADAFVVAFRIPNLLRDLFAEGALSAAFVPTFTDTLKNQGRERAIRLANLVIGAILVVVGSLTLLGIFLAPWIVDAMAPGFGAVEGKRDITILCTRIMFPFLPLVSLAAVTMGQLNAQERFGPPAFASALFNVVAIVGGAFLFWAAAREEQAVIGWSIFTLFGGAAQLLVQVPAARELGHRFRLVIDFADPGLRRIARLMGPATVGLAATQVNLFVNTIFASRVEGAPAWLIYAFRLMQLPIGVFSVAVATIATAGLARRAAARDLEGMRSTLGQGLRLVAFLAVPSMLGLVALREPIVRLLFEHGRFRPEDTIATAWA